MIRASDLRVLPALASFLAVGLAFPGAAVAADDAADDEELVAEMERDLAEELAKPPCRKPDREECEDDEDDREDAEDDRDHGRHDKDKPRRSLASLASAAPNFAYVRGTFEYSRPHVPFDYVGELVGEGLSTTFYDRGQVHRDAVGGRLEAGFAFSLNEWFFLLPHAAFAFARIDTIVRQVDVAGVNQSWTSNPTWLAGMLGAELQFQRLVGFSVDIGAAALTDQLSNPRPVDLRVSNAAHGGVLVRLGLDVRLPVSNRFGAGFTGAVEGFVAPNITGDAARGGRFCLGVFVEWDQSRKAGPTP